MDMCPDVAFALLIAFLTAVAYSEMALIRVWTMIAFSHRKSNVLIHKIIPFVGLLLNLLMIVTILYAAALSGGDTKKAAFLAIGIAFAWGIVSVIYVVVNNARHGRSLMAHPSPTT